MRHHGGWTSIVFGVLAGMNIALLAVHFVDRNDRAFADTAVDGGGFLMATSTLGGGANEVYVLDAAGRHLAVYGTQGGAQGGLLALKAVRDITYDLQLTERGQQTPKVQEVFDEVKKAEQARRDREREKENKEKENKK